MKCDCPGAPTPMAPRPGLTQPGYQRARQRAFEHHRHRRRLCHPHPVNPVDPSTLRVDSVIGARRLSPYLAAYGADAARAVRLYSWNIEASAALLGAYAALEVGVRNAMHGQLTVFYDRPDWWEVAPLSTPQREEVRGASEYLDARKPGTWTDGHLVAELKNSFWEGLLVNRLHAALWNPALVRAFPNFTGRRGNLRDRMERLRLLRNRAAHHEPIHERDLRVDHRFMCDVASYVSHDLGVWIATHSRLPEVIDGREDTLDGSRPTRF